MDLASKAGKHLQLKETFERQTKVPMEAFLKWQNAVLSVHNLNSITLMVNGHKDQELIDLILF